MCLLKLMKFLVKHTKINDSTHREKVFLWALQLVAVLLPNGPEMKGQARNNHKCKKKSQQMNLGSGRGVIVARL